MTDFWPDDDTDNIWRMTDEAWAAYQAWKIHGDADSRPSDGYSGSGRGIPVGQPRIDRKPAGESLPPLLASLEFLPTCQVKGCEYAAAAFISWHPVNGSCTHPAYRNDGRLFHTLVCDGHLKAYERKAEVAVEKLRPSFLERFFRGDYGRCPSCGKAIQSASDVLTFVRSL